MNKYPVWLNTLVLVILLSGCLFALPNIYGSVEAVQIASNDGEPYTETKLDEFVRTIENAGVTPEAAYLQDGRVVIRFLEAADQETAGTRLREAYSREANVATTLTPKLPEWLRKLGLKPMSLGLDLRGGVYVLLEVDMATAIEGRLRGYQQDFEDRLREARIRHRVDLDGQIITVRLTGPEDLEAARDALHALTPAADGVDAQFDRIAAVQFDVIGRWQGQVGKPGVIRQHAFLPDLHLRQRRVRIDEINAEVELPAPGAVGQHVTHRGDQVGGLQVTATKAITS